MKKIVKRANGTIRVMTMNDGETETQQQFRNDCDVNVIMKKIMKGQQVPLNHKQGVFGDFTNMPSYEEALQNVITANDHFGRLPSDTRLRFANNPQNLMDFLKDPKNNEESYKLGLRVKVPDAPPDKTLEALNAIKENTKPPKKTKVED